MAQELVSSDFLADKAMPLKLIRRETGKTPRDIRASGKWQKRRERKKL